MTARSSRGLIRRPVSTQVADPPHLARSVHQSSAVFSGPRTKPAESMLSAAMERRDKKPPGLNEAPPSVAETLRGRAVDSGPVVRRKIQGQVRRPSSSSDRPATQPVRADDLSKARPEPDRHRSSAPSYLPTIRSALAPRERQSLPVAGRESQSASIRASESTVKEMPPMALRPSAGRRRGAEWQDPATTRGAGNGDALREADALQPAPSRSPSEGDSRPALMEPQPLASPPLSSPLLASPPLASPPLSSPPLAPPLASSASSPQRSSLPQSPPSSPTGPSPTWSPKELSPPVLSLRPARSEVQPASNNGGAAPELRSWRRGGSDTEPQATRSERTSVDLQRPDHPPAPAPKANVDGEALMRRTLLRLEDELTSDLERRGKFS